MTKEETRRRYEGFAESSEKSERDRCADERESIDERESVAVAAATARDTERLWSVRIRATWHKATPSSG